MYIYNMTILCENNENNVYLLHLDIFKQTLNTA